MTTIEDMRRLAAMAGETTLVAAIDRFIQPRPPAVSLPECERAAGIATCNPQTEESQ